jgi:hypothetical protein
MNEENLEILKNYINEKIEKYVENTVVSVDTANTPKVNYWCGYIKALEDLKDFLGIKEDE